MAGSTQRARRPAPGNPPVAMIPRPVRTPQPAPDHQGAGRALGERRHVPRARPKAHLDPPASDLRKTLQNYHLRGSRHYCRCLNHRHGACRSFRRTSPAISRPGLSRARLADEPGHPDPLGPALYPVGLRLALRCVGARDGLRLVLSPAGLDRPGCWRLRAGWRPRAPGWHSPVWRDPGCLAGRVAWPLGWRPPGRCRTATAAA